MRRNTEIVIRLFPEFPALETWRISVPRIRDRLHRIEPCSPDGRPGGTPAFPLREVVQGLSLALLKAASEVGTPCPECVLRFVLWTSRLGCACLLQTGPALRPSPNAYGIAHTARP